MRRLIITLTIALGLVVPTVAVASRVATGITRTAIDQAAGLVYPDRCLIARITTKDGGNWAGVSFNAAKQRSCKDSAFTGVNVVHRVGGRWQYVTSGSAGIRCVRRGIPVAVRQDLHLPCAATLPAGPPGARHSREFLSPDRKIWCVSGDGTPGIPFACGTDPSSETYPMLSASLYNGGKVTICFITHLIQQPGRAPDACFENWDPQAPVLRVGQENYVDGVLCKSETNGITCTLTAGVGKGKGFFIDSTSVRRARP